MVGGRQGWLAAGCRVAWGSCGWHADGLLGLLSGAGQARARVSLNCCMWSEAELPTSGPGPAAHWVCPCPWPAGAELDQEREASSCKAWQLLEEEAAQRDAACQRVRQLEAQLEESWELVHQLREQAQLWCLEAQPAAKRARCTAAEPAGGLVLAASDGWEGPPADSEAGEGATWRTAQKQAAEQRHLADQAPESLANTTSQLQPAARSVGQKAEPAAAAAQLHHDGQPDSASMPAGGSEWAPAAASSSTHIQPLLQQGQPAGWQDFMTPQLIAEHRAFAPLMAQALFNDFVKSQQGSRGGARPNGGSKKRRRKAAVP